MGRGDLRSRPLGTGTWRVLKWAWEHECPWDGWAWNNADEGGHADVLEWLDDNDCPVPLFDIPACMLGTLTWQLYNGPRITPA